MKTIKIMLLLAVLLVSTNPVFSQETSGNVCVADSVIYARHLNDTFEKYYPINLILKIYVYLLQSTPSDSAKNVKVSVQRTNRGCNYTDECKDYYAGFAAGGSDGPVLVGTDEGTGIVRRMEDSMFPDKLRWPFQHGLRACMKEYHKKSTKNAFVQKLISFKGEAVHRPTVFNTIDSLYGGDVNLYAKNLFKKSILLNVHRNDRFIRKPSAEKFITDPGVQFLISLAKYRLWMHSESSCGK